MSIKRKLSLFLQKDDDYLEMPQKLKNVKDHYFCQETTDLHQLIQFVSIEMERPFTRFNFDALQIKSNHRVQHMTQDPLSLIKTPNKWHKHPIRITPNIPALIRPNINVFKLPRPYTKQSITTQTAKNIIESLHFQQSPPPTPNEDNKGQISDLSCSPSLKTQKKQYLKLFTTASTNRQESINSNHSVCDSNQSVMKQQLPSFNSQKQDVPQVADLGKKTPRRRLFSDFGIENEEKIMVEQNNGQSCILFGEFLMHMPRLTSSMSQTPFRTEEGLDAEQMFQICSGCFKFLPIDIIHQHQGHCCKYQTFLSMHQNERFEFIRQRSIQLMRKIEQQAGRLQSGDLASLVGHCNTFLKECELAWSTGRPSQIYNFKLKELQASSAKLVGCVQDIHRLNFLLALPHTHTHQQSLIQ